MHMTLMGNDPGTGNNAYSIVRVKFRPPFRYQVLNTGLLQNVVYDLTGGIRSQSRPFKKEVSGIIKQYGVDVLVAERYQNRGMQRGNTIELVNFMLGALDSLRVQDYVVITPAQWKNAFNKFYDLKEFYREIKMVPHRIDATLIALYGAYQYLDVKTSQFDFLNTKKGLATLRQRIEATNA